MHGARCIHNNGGGAWVEILDCSGVKSGHFINDKNGNFPFRSPCIYYIIYVYLRERDAFVWKAGLQRRVILSFSPARGEEEKRKRTKERERERKISKTAEAKKKGKRKKEKEKKKKKGRRSPSSNYQNYYNRRLYNIYTSVRRRRRCIAGGVGRGGKNTRPKEKRVRD